MRVRDFAINISWRLIMKIRWIKNWFLNCDYRSGEMIRTWLKINGYNRISNIWKNYMFRRINELHKNY